MEVCVVFEVGERGRGELVNGAEDLGCAEVMDGGERGGVEFGETFAEGSVRVILVCHVGLADVRRPGRSRPSRLWCRSPGENCDAWTQGHRHFDAAF